MKIKFIAINVLSQNDQSIIKTIDVTPDENIIQACQRIGNIGMIITFNSYYLRCNEMMSSDDCFPFILKNDVVEWNVAYSEVSVSQFIYTHPNALIDGIVFEHGFPAAGGADWYEAWELIVQWTPVIWSTAVMFCEAKDIFTTAQSVISWFENKYKDKRKMPYPHSFTDYIYHKDIWNHHELSVQLVVNEEQAKLLLKAYGYRWDRSKLAYIVDKKVKEVLINRENKIAYLDI